MSIDNLPGYLKDCRGVDKGGAREMFIGSDAALYHDSKVTLFEYLASENSSSLTVELPYLEKYYNIEDPEKFTVYHYDIGEPSITVQGETMEGTPVKVENGDKLRLCRADMVSGGREGYLDFSVSGIQAVDSDFSDGVTLKAMNDCQIGIAGLIVPYQLKEEEILFNPEKNETGLMNRVANIEYIVWDGKESARYQKPVTLTRKFADGTEYGSVMEFYHFTRDRQAENDVSWSLSDGTAGPLSVILTMKQKAGYLQEYELRRALTSMKPSPEKRPDQTLEEFANFRAITTTGIRPDTLYRSSSPIDNRDGRQEAADQCLKKYGIDHVINLYNTKEQAEAMEGYKDTYASTLDTAFINVSLDYTSVRFGEKMADIMNYLADNTGKFVLHCILGEHRTGAVCIVLSALMGASYDEIIDDYMQTCINLYDVKPGTKQYDLIVNDNVNAVLKLLLNTEDPKNADLKSLAEDYILSTGITEETIGKVREHLGE